MTAPINQTDCAAVHVWLERTLLQEGSVIGQEQLNFVRRVQQHMREVRAKLDRGIVEDGGPAFPVGEEALVRNLQGMSLRDHFAGEALQGLLSGMSLRPTPDSVAKYSYEIADAMLKARAS